METLPERARPARHVRRWSASAFTKAATAIPVYSTVIAVGSLLLLQRASRFRKPASETAIWVALLHVTGNGSLQAIFALGLTLLCRWVTGATWGGLAGLGMVVAGGFLTQVIPGCRSR